MWKNVRMCVPRRVTCLLRVLNAVTAGRLVHVLDQISNSRFLVDTHRGELHHLSYSVYCTSPSADTTSLGQFCLQISNFLFWMLITCTIITYFWILQQTSWYLLLLYIYRHRLPPLLYSYLHQLVPLLQVWAYSCPLHLHYPTLISPLGHWLLPCIFIAGLGSYWC